MVPHDIFGNLRELTLSCYHDENVAFPSDFHLQRFPNLKRLRVECSSFEEIFAEDAFGGLNDMKKPLKEFGNLEQFWLVKLCNLRRVWKGGSLMAEILKQIDSLFFLECSSLPFVCPSPTSFQSLTQLRVWSCDGLVHMGTCSGVKSLVHLLELALCNCGAMEDVVTGDGNGVDLISFPKLEELTLSDLPCLESFSPTNCTFMFPSLERVVVTQCPQMNMFCKGALRAPKLDKVLLSDGYEDRDDEGRWEGDLNTTIQTLST